MSSMEKIFAHAAMEAEKEEKASIIEALAKLMTARRL